MSLKNTSEQYGTLTIAIHWIMAIIIIGMITAGFTIGLLPDGDQKMQIINLHKAGGVAVLILALFRWFWMLTNKRPNPLPNWSKADIAISHATKWLLMILLIVMPIAGMVMSRAAGHDIHFFGLFTIEAFAEKDKPLAGLFHSIHVIGGWLIAIIVGLHILAAFKHHLLKKDDTLNRMLGRK